MLDAWYHRTFDGRRSLSDECIQRTVVMRSHNCHDIFHGIVHCVVDGDRSQSLSITFGLCAGRFTGKDNVMNARNKAALGIASSLQVVAYMAYLLATPYATEDLSAFQCLSCEECVYQSQCYSINACADNGCDDNQEQQCLPGPGPAHCAEWSSSCLDNCSE